MMLVSKDEFFSVLLGFEKSSQSPVWTDDLGKQNLGKRSGALYSTNSWRQSTSVPQQVGRNPKNLELWPGYLSARTKTLVHASPGRLGILGL
jgi:hypothetical protein